MKAKTSKTLMNKLINAVGAGRITEQLQTEWIVENIVNMFKGRYPDEMRSVTMDELEQQCKTNGIEVEKKEKRLAIKMKHYTIKASPLSGWSYNKGDYKGFDFYFSDKAVFISACWVKAESVIDFLHAIDEAMPHWISEDWPKVLFEAQKKAKIKAISENTIETMLQMKLKGRGIPYALEKQKTRVKVMFDIGSNSQVEIFMSHKRFPEQIDRVIELMTEIKSLVDDTDMILSVKRLRRDVDWHECN